MCLKIHVCCYFYLRDAEQDKPVEVKTPRRGRSSKPTEEETKDEPTQVEKLEETPSRRRRRSAPKEAAAGKLLTLN